MKSGGMARRLAVIFSVAGAVFCALAALGFAERICVSSGCDLYHEWTVLGLSLWWWGAGGFALMAAMALASPAAALVLAGAALVADTALLCAMALLAPCGNCLIAGVGFFAAWLCLRRAVGACGGVWALLPLLWLAALSPNLLALATDDGGWAVYGDATARTRVYFSTSCPHCRHALFDLSAAIPQDVAFIPVSEASGDVERIIALHKALEAGQPFREAFVQAVRPDFEPVERGLWEYWGYRLRVARNHAAFRHLGGRSVPLIVMTGWGALAKAVTQPLIQSQAPVVRIAPGEPRPEVLPDDQEQAPPASGDQGGQGTPAP